MIFKRCFSNLTSQASNKNIKTEFQFASSSDYFSYGNLMSSPTVFKICQQNLPLRLILIGLLLTVCAVEYHAT